MWSPLLQANIHCNNIVHVLRTKEVNAANGSELWCKGTALLDINCLLPSMIGSQSGCK